MSPCPRALALVLAAAAAWAVRPAAAGAQQTGGGGQAARGCRLVLVPGSDSTRSVSQQVVPGQYITHWSGGLRWTCGASRMTADSAVKFDVQHRLEAIGAVHYRDSLRTLTADSLTYWQDEDRLVAAGNVHLVRLRSKSELHGPRVEFFRPGGSGPQRTVATGRPHMTVRDTTGKGPPAEIDADRMVFRGEEEAHLSGDVRIVRGDTRARADSATYVDRDHVGRLLGSPVVTREDFRLAGKTIAAEIDSGQVRAVQARGDAEAEGESFRLFSDAIDARVADETIDRLWAHGQSPALAVSAPYRLDGDSLVFAFRHGDIDTLKAVGRASAVEVGDSASGALGPADRASPPPAAADEQNWVRGDTLVLAFEPAEAVAGGTTDTAGVPSPADSAGSVRTDTAGGAAAEVASAADTGGARAAPDDTTGAAPSDTAAGTRKRRLELIRAIGSARAYYLVPRDSAGASRPARNYLVGREVTVFFAEGKADRVDGVDAIGVFLDPEEEGGG
ncbi:MAG TPA: LptA/OstA family protein [Gemmatimonadota bacterium]|nr:LptA/OstA family protein [Gemmatimonadota bacterium]